MIGRDIIVIGASAGGIAALSKVVADLPADLAAALFVVIHISPQSPGYIPQMLASQGPLRAKNAEDGEHFIAGNIYVAPPDQHMLLNADGVIQTSRGPRENHTRPAADPLFRSAALAFGARVIGIVLSGGLDDGTSGLRAIKMCGGTTVVQDPADAEAQSMPLTALRSVTIDYSAPAKDLGRLIAQLVAQPFEPSLPMEDNMRKLLEFEVSVSGNTGHSMDVLKFGEPSQFTCPECHGTLMRLRGERPARYRCHTGHAFTADSLLADLSETVESALWNSIRSIQESAMLLNHLSDHWRDKDQGISDTFTRRAQAALHRAELVRKVAEFSKQEETQSDGHERFSDSPQTVS